MYCNNEVISVVSDIILVTLRTCAYYGDIISDCWLCSKFYQNGEGFYFGLTLFFIILSWVFAQNFYISE